MRKDSLDTLDQSVFNLLESLKKGHVTTLEKLLRNIRGCLESVESEMGKRAERECYCVRIILEQTKQRKQSSDISDMDEAVLVASCARYFHVRGL